MERRKAPRHKKRLSVRFWSAEHPEPKTGFTLNLSHKGAFIATSTPFSVGTWVTIEMPLGKKKIHLESLVRSSIRVDPALRRIKQSGMGVRLLRTEELIQGILSPKQGDSQEETPDRESPDSETAVEDKNNGESQVFSMYIDTPTDLAEIFDRHIQHGGVFVPTNGEAEVEEHVGLQFLFDWSPETVIQATGKVVKTFAAAGSDGHGGLTGIGVAFTSPDETIDHFRQLLPVPGDPNAGSNPLRVPAKRDTPDALQPG